MAKIIKTIAIENGMGVDDINSFETENYIGIYDDSHNDFIILSKESGGGFGIDFLGYRYGEFSNFEEFDNAVFKICEEHILEVFKSNSYAITLTGEE